MRANAVVAALLLAAALPAAAQLYRWTDDAGRVHFTDSPPPPNAKNVQKRGAPAAVPQAKGGPAGSAPEPFVLQQARKDYPVTLYSTPGCDACGEARKLLNARGIPFKEVSVTDEAQIAELKSAVGSNSVPSMLVGRTVVRGFEEGNYHRTLDAAGYPKTGVLPPRSQAEPTPVEPAKPEVKPVEAPPKPGLYAPR